jgi:diguanylate cyclase (GGDEF)-like protein/PAS domain S-box-containing protein
MNGFIQTNFNPPMEWSEQPQRILIVDDEPRMRSSLRLLLEGEGREIHECETGGDAIATLKSQEIALVLLDISLPDISGLEVMDWISSTKLSTSVIIVSADDSIDSAIRALRNGVVEFIRKPQGLDEIQHKVESCLLRRRLERSNGLMTARLEQSERLHRFMVEKSPDLIYTLDTDGRFMFINDRVESLLGYSRDELIGRRYSVFIHNEDLEKAVYAFTERRSDSRATTNVEFRLKRKNNQYLIAMLSAIGIYEFRQEGQDSKEKRFMGTYGVARDITERKIAEETISFQAFHDQLTQLPNRRLFKDRLELSMSQSKRHGGVVGVMFIDLDRFKLVNDTHGHAEGDELLKSVARRLRNCMRASDTLARQGGDEFTVLLPDLAQADDAIVIVEKILNEFRVPFHVAGQNLRVTVSIGISVFPRDGESADALLKHADIAMFRVKNDGKNGFKFYDPEMNVCHHERITRENELRNAVKNSEFELHYQPQICVKGDRIVGLEALVRWRHPVHGLLFPGSFIDMAEEIGLIHEITDWVLSEACGQLARWRAMGLDNLRISINVSPQEFNRNDLVERIACNVSNHGLPEDVLEIEITENPLLQDVSGVIDKMHRLRECGIRISIDDFGTHYSSLNYLRRIPINTIKIDQSFVHDLAEGQICSPIIPAIICIARGFGLNLVAEGVETDYQMKTLRDLGCDEMQGFFFSRPLPAADVEHLLCNAFPTPQDRFTS